MFFNESEQNRAKTAVIVDLKHDNKINKNDLEGEFIRKKTFSSTWNISARTIPRAVIYLCCSWTEEVEEGLRREALATAREGLVGVRCASHTTQLSVKGLLQSGGAAAALLARIRRVVVKTHTQNIRLVFLKNKKPLPVIDVETRWNSSYNMLKSVLEIRDFLDELSHQRCSDCHKRGLKQRHPSHRGARPGARSHQTQPGEETDS